MKKRLNNRPNHKSFDLSRFFSKIGQIKQKKTLYRLFHILLPQPVCVYVFLYVYVCVRVCLYVCVSASEHIYRRVMINKLIAGPFAISDDINITLGPTLLSLNAELNKAFNYT